MTRKKLSLNFGREPIVRPHEYERAKRQTAAKHKADMLDRAGELLAKLKADEPAMRERLDAAFADMAEARKDLRKAVGK